MASTETAPATPLTTARRAWWRASANEPRYARPALLAILAMAALLYAWGIGDSPFHSFYADAVRSMSESWKAFFFGSFDPANSITLDKLPGFLWPQALSARLFGFHSWALTLPQVLEGIGSVLVMYLLVKRWMGVNAALLACGAFLCIPAADGLFRTQTEDPLFTLCVLLAALATQKAAQTGALRPLLMAGVWIGLGFQAKMLEAWVVLPALAVLYLVMAPVALRKRIAHVATAGAVTLAVSSVWVLAVTLIPANDRPYVDGTTDNSAVSMVVGYNFLNRFSSVGLDASGTGSISATQGGHGGRAGGGAAQHDAGAATGGSGGAAASEAGDRAFRSAGAAPDSALGAGGGFPGGSADENGWGKMFGSSLASQTGWLYPLAALAVVLGLVWRRREPRTDPVRGGFLLLGLWLTSYFLVFSAGAVNGHTYYMGVIAVPSAALAGGGVALMWRAYREGGRRVWALSTAVGGTAVWSAWVAAQFPGYGVWLSPLSLLLGLGAVTALLLGRPHRAPSSPRPRGRTVATVGLLTGLASVLLAPAVWASQVFAPGSSMSSMMGNVGPSASGGSWGATGRTALASGHRGTPDGGRLTGAFSGSGAFRGGGSRDAGDRPGFGGRGGQSGNGTQLSSAQQALLQYTSAHRGSAEYDFATTSWSAASPYILDDGAPILAMGGFSGQVPFPSLTGLESLVHAGQLKFVAIGGAGGAMNAFLGGQSADATGPTAALTAWVTAHCAKVPAQDYSGANATSGTSQTLYECLPQGRTS
ncbi:ArnT family glycosyltransferase [Arthrobacter sp. NPDC090010]|uniref:ArnT family glycosyltransferase n=1 Tax=Arthrobacter sp. NPDC090010 TaxID=3363942 RepID=UPI00382C71A2